MTTFMAIMVVLVIAFIVGMVFTAIDIDREIKRERMKG